MTLKNKLIALVVAALAGALVLAVVSLMTLKQSMLQDRHAQIENLLGMAEHMVAHFQS